MPRRPTMSRDRPPRQSKLKALLKIHDIQDWEACDESSARFRAAAEQIDRELVGEPLSTSERAQLDPALSDAEEDEQDDEQDDDACSDADSWLDDDAVSEDGDWMPAKRYKLRAASCVGGGDRDADHASDSDHASAAGDSDHASAASDSDYDSAASDESDAGDASDDSGNDCAPADSDGTELTTPPTRSSSEA